MIREFAKKVATRFRVVTTDEKGATAIEYGLLAALIAVIIIGAVRLVGSNLSATFNNVAKALS
jgi:pilus assembly protein Flp/PilA